MRSSSSRAASRTSVLVQVDEHRSSVLSNLHKMYSIKFPFRMRRVGVKESSRSGSGVTYSPKPLPRKRLRRVEPSNS